MYKGKTIGVVIPAYNEAGFVGEVIETLPSFVDRAYVIDDGSTDGTWEE
ncbi:glycosyltransferase, partial [Streptomyces thermocarboxydus]